ncbi:peroxidase [Neorhizobium sp. JUb45]|uniref:Dyp-type peroxidase n=1 Tax=unclassified Neorhizobium TaxID=2629175 RepID=UPI0010470EE9|nr:peroxidase [Neorhizobium sp. JUb45]TCR00997.1 Dyp-type peroxidase family [Neorhizobium sp. JUb45]
MAIDFENAIAWKKAAGAERVMLDNLQPNILKGHVREFLTVLFLSFDDPAGGRAFLRTVAGGMKSAWRHFKEIDTFKKTMVPGTSYIGVGLSRAGYIALDLPIVPSDPAFVQGMQANPKLNDPNPQEWEEHFRKPSKIHAVILVGDMLSGTRDAALAQVVAWVNAGEGVSVLARQDGLGQHNDNAEGIEHFGYVDGRSQPLFLEEDVSAEEQDTDGITDWNPSCPLKQVIVPDPGAPDPDVHCGSYFIFRKLEQNVRLFKESERDFANSLGIPGDERAGAMLVGRFEDGTPVTMQFEDGVESPVPNNFNYASDTKGAKCPFAGHIRKTNPRGSGGFGQPEKQERTHIMARRGQTYGIRTDDLNDGRIDNKPEKDVGLLFMAFNSDIGQQFEFTQVAWANGIGFPEVPDGSPAPGVDPIIGQTPNDAQRPAISCPVKWGDAKSIKTVAAPPRTVTMKGGEYFFMPSLAFLKNI